MNAPMLAGSENPDDADKAYDYRRCRNRFCTNSVQPLIGRRSVETSQGLGRHWSSVDRTLAWLTRVLRCWAADPAIYFLDTN